MGTRNHVAQICIVPDCLSAYYSGCGIRFHLFPREIDKRNEWLKSLNLSMADYHKDAKLCYLHFNFSDYCNNDPKKKLKSFALPHVNINRRMDYDDSDDGSIDLEQALKKLEEMSSSSENEQESLDYFDEEIKTKKNVTRIQKPTKFVPEVSENKIKKGFVEIKKEEYKFEDNLSVKEEEKLYKLEAVQSDPESTKLKSNNDVLTNVCKTCLATGCKMYCIKKYNLDQTYLHVTGITVDMYNDSVMPQSVCFECLQRLRNFIKFSTKSLTAWSLLMELIEDNKLSIENITRIDRNKHMLSSKLTSTTLEPNHFNIQVEEYDENDNEIIDNENINNEDINESTDKDYDNVNTYFNLKEDYNLGNSFEVKEEVEIETLDFDNNQNSEPKNYYNPSENEHRANKSDDSNNSKRKKFRKKYIRGYNEKFLVKSLTPEEHAAQMEIRKNSSEYKNATYKCVKCYTGFDSEQLFKEHLEVHNNPTLDNIHIDPHQNLITTKHPNHQFESNYFDMQVEEYEYENQDNVQVIYNEEEITTITGDDTKKFNTGDTNEYIDWDEDYDDYELQTKRSDEKIDDESDEDDIESKKLKLETLDDMFDDLFTVKLMTTEEQIDYMEKRKFRYKNDQKKFQCDICYRGYQKESSFNEHMRKHTDECGSYVCSVCQIHFMKHPYLVKHMSNAHEKLISCRKCSFTTPREMAANEHRKNHVGARFQCKLCPKSFLKHTTYVDHNRRCHPGDVICHLCGLSFVHVTQLDSHFVLKHRNEDLHLLPSTSTFPFGLLQRNRLSEVNTAVSYLSTLPDDAPHCTKCNIRFLDEPALRSHLTYSPTHGNVARNKPRRPQYRRSRKKESKRYTCEQCSEDFVNYHSYTIHFGRAHPNKQRTQYLYDRPQYVCDLCGKYYQNVTNLNDHRQSHSGVTLHSCNICGKSFKTKMTLSAHKLNHTHALQCSECGKSFTQFTNLRRHRLLHTEKPYECAPCGKRFVSPTDKRHHIKHFHMGVPWPKKPPGAPKRKPKEKSDVDKELTRSEQSIAED